MKLTIIVVNYNVKYFLNICLKSLVKALEGIESEVVVVDNASSDGSTHLLKKNFPMIRLIENEENIGFGRACNQGIEVSRGEYILIINPDTLVGESLIPEILSIMDHEPGAGALGVRLMDGKGKILRESKRAIPTLWSGFTKFSGLGKLFHKVSFLNQYYAPTLDYNERGEVEVLPGAFMLIRRSVLDEIGGFDPRFFMYAEDIDLSYRISKAGHGIIYAGHLTAIHFKGESTEKSLWAYTETFFTSMRLFVQKYTGELYSKPVSWVLQRMISMMLWIQGHWKTRIWGKEAPAPLRLEDWNLLLSSDLRIGKKLKEKNGISITRVPGNKNESSAEAVHLRYIPALIKTELDFSLFLDIDSLSYDQIVSLWIHQKERPFYLLDRENSYFIVSADKERQGKIYSFDEEKN